VYKLIQTIFPLSLILLAGACQGPGLPAYQSRGFPVINGYADDDPAHLAVVAVWTQGFLCSGTLIAPRVVLTAAHCVDGFGPGDSNVYFGPALAGGEVRGVAEIWRHPQYSEHSLINDIALLRLSADPPDGVSPIPHLPHRLRISAMDIGVEMQFTGFGQDENGNSGVKLTMFNDLAWICTENEGCGGMNPAHINTICQDQTPSGLCQGDSGGPAFIVRDGREYVAGIASYVGEGCRYFGCSTKVDEFEDKIIQFAGDPEGAPCENARDCLTGHCVDEVCCESDCAGRCMSCNQEGSGGICLPVPDGTPCLDSNVCNGEEVCREGLCREGLPLTCADQVACTFDTCDPIHGCTFNPMATECDDGNMCTKEVCDRELGCLHDPMPDGIACGDCLICETGACIDDPACKDDGCNTSGGPPASLLLSILILALSGRLSCPRRRHPDGYRTVKVPCHLVRASSERMPGSPPARG